MAADHFLKLDGIQGESKDQKHQNEIEIMSWSFGQTNSGTFASGGGGGAAKVSMGDFNFSMMTNKASPPLFLACATGKHIGSAVLTCRKAGGEQQEYLKVNFKDVLISSWQISGTGEIPSESFSLNFATISWEYNEQKADGTLAGKVKAEFNLKTMKANAG
jgi:type VI secretion system secreted protein Hcp